jgi:PAS domain S-box-containing protein
VNPTATTLFARSEGDLVGRSPLEFIAPEYHAQTRARIRLVLTQGKIAPPADVEVLRPDGSRRIVQATSTLIEDEGQPAILALMRDVTAVRAVEAELKQSHARLKALVGAQDAWQEEERKRVSREIHDDLQQALAALKIDLSMLARRLRAPSAGAAADAEAMEMLQAADALADAAIVSTRRVVENLRPRILDEGGLVDAIVGTLGDFERRTGIQARLNAREPGCESCLSPDCVTCLYRVFQEALNNVRKHSGATRVDVSLARIAPGEVRLRIHDDGRGIEPSDPEKPRSFGLLGMSERLAAVGGRMQLAGAPEEGTCLDAFVPCPACARDRPGE